MFNRVRAILELPERVNGVLRKVEGLHSHFSTVILAVQRMHGQVNELGVVTAILSNKVGSDNALSHAAIRHNKRIRDEYSTLLNQLDVAVTSDELNQESTCIENDYLNRAMARLRTLTDRNLCLTNTNRPI